MFSGINDLILWINYLIIHYLINLLALLVWLGNDMSSGSSFQNKLLHFRWLIAYAKSLRPMLQQTEVHEHHFPHPLLHVSQIATGFLVLAQQNNFHRECQIFGSLDVRLFSFLLSSICITCHFVQHCQTWLCDFFFFFKLGVSAGFKWTGFILYFGLLDQESLVKVAECCIKRLLCSWQYKLY